MCLREDNPAPDFMSRCKQDKQVGLALIYSDQECWDVESPIIASVTQALNCDMNDRAVTFSRVERTSESDDEICNLRKFLLENDRFNRLPEELSHYNRYRDRLSVLGPCVMYDRRILVPAALMQEVLKGLHSAHQAVVSMSNTTKLKLLDSLLQEIT